MTGVQTCALPIFTIAEAVAAYKNLARVESAFKELKNFIDLRPMYHWAKERVEAHVFICVLAYLIEICLELKLKRAGVKMTARKALDLLSEIKMVKLTLEGMKLSTYSKPPQKAQELIHILHHNCPNV